MGLAPDKEGGGVAWLKRLWPLLLLLAAAGLILAMGWQRYLTLQELVLRREALRAAIAGHPLLALVVFMAIYAGTVALSLPGGAVLTLAGGFLFGWFWGGLASIVAAALGAIIVFLVARSALGEPFAARAGPWLGRLRQGFPGGCIQLSALPAPRPRLPVLARQSSPGAAWRRPLDLCACHPDRHHSGKFCLFHRRQRTGQPYRGSASCAPILPCQDGTRCGKVMPIRARAWGVAHAGAPCRLRSAWARGAYPDCS